MEMTGMREKTQKRNNKTKEKILRLVTLPSPLYNMEADCFPLSERTGNKLDLP